TLRLQSGTHEQLLPMQHRARGYFDVTVANARAGDHYTFRLERDGESIDRPDPASRCQVDDVHGASQIVSRGFDWTDGHWRGCELAEYIFYELHIGTFTKVGTFDAAAAHLDELRDLGITAIELMPVAQFPGSRNWGYDGVLPFAVQNSYGGPQALKRFVNACH